MDEVPGDKVVFFVKCYTEQNSINRPIVELAVLSPPRIK